MNIFFDDTEVTKSLYPFTAVRNAADIRVGIFTIREKWNILLTKMGKQDNSKSITVNAAVIPTKKYVQAFLNDTVQDLADEATGIKMLKHPWDIFHLNDWAIREDFALITEGRVSAKISASNKITVPENIFIEEGARMEHCIINAATGPVYIGKNAEVMEGCIIRGPFALCEGAVLKMGAKVYGASTIGPYSIGGGEIKNSVLFAYSNKAHDGYLGDSVLGEWCNLGAGTSNSNIKNTAATVRVWHNQTKSFLPAGLKCGLLMGDYSRAAINTSFNTGTVVGICCNIFAEGFPPKLVNDFTWGKERYTFEKVLEDISNWKKLKNKTLTQKERDILKTLYNQ